MPQPYPIARIAIVAAIVERAYETGQIKAKDRTNVEMSIEAADCEVGLNLRKLLHATPFTFSHDVLGIDRHISRTTGRLSDHFLPRCICRRRPPNLPKYPNWFRPAQNNA